LVFFGVSGSQELVVFLVNRELKGMLVVSKERVVTIGQIRKRTAQIETVLNGRAVVHGSEVVLLDGQDHQLLENLVTHHELLGSTRNISVVVENSHTSETSDLDLNCDVTGQIGVDLGLLGGVHTGVECSSGVIETLVPNLEYHL
jgi:hypothetical protein